MKQYLTPPMLSATFTPQGRQLKTRLEYIFSKNSKKKGYFVPVLVVLTLCCGTLIACVPKAPVTEAKTVKTTEHGTQITTPEGDTIIVASPLPEEFEAPEPELLPETDPEPEPELLPETDPEPDPQPENLPSAETEEVTLEPVEEVTTLPAEPQPAETEEPAENQTATPDDIIITYEQEAADGAKTYQGGTFVTADGAMIVIGNGGDGNPVPLGDGQTLETAEGTTVVMPRQEEETPRYENDWPQDDNLHLSRYTSQEGYIRPYMGNVYPLTISQAFGTRTHPVTGQEVTHYGVDVVLRYGLAVCAVADGVVEQAGWDDVYGNCVVIRHADGSSSMYGHLSAYHVAVGDTVVQKQYIGNVGDTGEATGTHLHFELRDANNLAVDPTYLFQ